MVRVVAAKSKRAGSLDYVAAWFIKAATYLKGGVGAIAFVATNSLTQGEQVAQLWPILFGRGGLEIAFAHRTFAWGSDARGKAHVHVVILGLAQRRLEPLEKRLFSYDDINGEPVESRHKALSPYLIDAFNLRDRHLVIYERREPLQPNSPRFRMGSKIVDGGHYLFDKAEKIKFVEDEPDSLDHFRPIVGSHEYINGVERWILYLDGLPPERLRSMPKAAERVVAVRKFRQESKKAKTQELADFPTRFEVITIPRKPFLVMPEVSSERREYVPVGWMKPPTIPSNLVHVMADAEVLEFGVIVSRMHMAWLRYVGGRLKSDYRYSIGVVYNTFPWPQLDESAKAKIGKLAQDVLDAREAHPGATLADLYDPDVMPPDLRKAHTALDKAVDALYRRGGFASDRERVEHLFALYEKAVAPLQAAAGKPKRKRKGPASNADLLT